MPATATRLSVRPQPNPASPAREKLSLLCYFAGLQTCGKSSNIVSLAMKNFSGPTHPQGLYKWFHLRREKRLRLAPRPVSPCSAESRAKGDTFACDRRDVPNAGAYHSRSGRDINELQLTKPIRDSFLQGQQTNQTCPPEGEARRSPADLWMMCLLCR